MYVIDCNCIHVYLSQPHSPSTRLSGVFTARNGFDGLLLCLLVFEDHKGGSSRDSILS